MGELFKQSTARCIDVACAVLKQKLRELMFCIFAFIAQLGALHHYRLWFPKLIRYAPRPQGIGPSTQQSGWSRVACLTSCSVGAQSATRVILREFKLCDTDAQVRGGRSLDASTLDTQTPDA